MSSSNTQNQSSCCCAPMNSTALKWANRLLQIGVGTTVEMGGGRRMRTSNPSECNTSFEVLSLTPPIEIRNPLSKAFRSKFGIGSSKLTTTEPPCPLPLSKINPTTQKNTVALSRKTGGMNVLFCTIFVVKIERHKTV